VPFEGFEIYTTGSKVVSLRTCAVSDVKRRSYLTAAGVGGALAVAGCLDGDGGADGPAGPLTLATATTVHDSGLLDVVNGAFESAFGVEMRPVVRGTGGALRTARDGDCDVVLVHARSLEDQFLRSGHGLNRRALMYNDFLVVGPPSDPAGAAGDDPLAALRAIARAGATFYSRGDRSGTNVRELQLWDAAEIDPGGPWYRETGQGMGSTLVTAAEGGGYTLTDRGTFLATAVDGDLAAHVAPGLADPPPSLRNEYAVIPVNPARHDVAYPLAMAYAGYLTGPGRADIDEFRIDGDPAFRALGARAEPRFEQYAPTEWRR